jgi:putative transposase
VGKAVKKRKPGRPRIHVEIASVILRMAAENGWGLTRIQGELKKLGLKVGRSTIKRILVEAGYDIGPGRAEGSWDSFLTRHAQTIWACDFFSVRTVTTRGIVEMYLLFFINHGSRQVQLAGMTAHPEATWVEQ